MRETIEFFHTMAAIGFIGALAGLAVLHAPRPEPAAPALRRPRLGGLASAFSR